MRATIRLDPEQRLEGFGRAFALSRRGGRRGGEAVAATKLGRNGSASCARCNGVRLLVLQKRTPQLAEMKSHKATIWIMPAFTGTLQFKGSAADEMRETGRLPLDLHRSGSDRCPYPSVPDR